LSERLYALKDIVSPTTRKRIISTWQASTSWATWGGKLAGNAVWVVTTSALLVGLPLALAIENETMMVQQEKEMLAQQQGAQQVRGGPALKIWISTPDGLTDSFSTTSQLMGGQPGEPKSDGLRPPGF
jgi:import receptor subunit TOM22